MKQAIFILLCILSFSTDAQTIAGTPLPASQTQPTKAATADFVPRDFNYTFYPTDKYQRFGRFNILDTVSNTTRIMQDSSTKTTQVVVEKQGDELTIRGVADPTLVLYRTNIKFVGTTSDGRYSLIYKSTAKDEETIFINPTIGFVVVGFNVCDSEGKRCNQNFHYFGNAPSKLYLESQ